MGLLERMEMLPWMAGALVMVLAFVFFAVSGILLVRRMVPHQKLRAHHDVAGFIYTNLGVLYGVLLGFTVLNVQQHFDAVRVFSEVEASYLAQLYRDAQVFSDKDRTAVREAIKSYGDAVVKVEWPSMMKKEIHLQANSMLLNIWDVYYQIQPSNKQQEIWYAESINKLNSLMAARLQRLMGGGESLSSEMWILLIVGALVMLAFLWFFSLENLAISILMASVLATSTAFLLFLIYSLDTAYSGQIAVPPEAFERVLESFQPHV